LPVTCGFPWSESLESGIVPNVLLFLIQRGVTLTFRFPEVPTESAIPAVRKTITNDEAGVPGKAGT
jgi:hypothetical protein